MIRVILECTMSETVPESTTTGIFGTQEPAGVSGVTVAQQVKRGTMSSAAMKWVRQRILSGELPEGTIVRPETIGQELGISTTPAREALQALRTEGFLRSQAKVGFVVAPLTKDDILDIFTAHAFLAGELAARAVSRSTQQDLNHLEALHYELLAASRRGLSAEAEDRNHQFHRCISKLANAPKLAQILGIVSRYVPREFYSEVEGWSAASSSDHEAIVEAFRRADSEAARRAMTDHIRHAGELLAAQFAPS